MLLRIASMLTKLIALFDSASSSVVREESPEEKFEDEEEDENENGPPDLEMRGRRHG